MLSHLHGSVVAIKARCTSGRSLVGRSTAAVLPSGKRACAQRQPIRRLVRATEEATVDTEPGSENGAQVEAELSPLERVKKALESAGSEVVGCVDELEGEMASLRASADTSESRAAASEAAVNTVKEQLLRLNADFDNYRRRTAEEKEALSASVRSDVVGQLLPLVDNFELARTQVKAETENELKLVNSYQNLYKQMVDILRGLGVEAVPTVGTMFDPAIHDAIMREQNDDLPDGTVLVEYRKGFRLGEKLIRPAMVQVSFSENPTTSQSSVSD